MAGSKWVDTAEDIAADAQRKREKEEKKRAKLEKQRKAEEEEQAQKQQEAQAAATKEDGTDAQRPSKRRRLSETREPGNVKDAPRKLLRFNAPDWEPCRHVNNFETLNAIEEGSYGWVSRAKENATGQVVALKRLKMDNLNDGFPVTALREIQTLKASHHRHIVDLREIVTGSVLNEVYLVMEFLEHDLKTLQEDMREPFLPSETKTLMIQLTSAISYLHSHWIIHRDLKTSNILMNNKGEIKIADFGMARYTGDPPPANLTQLVVTLWYRSPELLLGATKYDFAVDIWSLGCIFGELLSKEPLLTGRNEVDQLHKVFSLCGIPSEENWPGYRRLPNAKSLKLPRLPHAPNPKNLIRAKFPFLTNAGSMLLADLLALDPTQRPVTEDILKHDYFSENPRPKATAMFPSFPSKAGQEKRRRQATPEAPKRGENGEVNELGDMDFTGIFKDREDEEVGAGFSLKMV